MPLRLLLAATLLCAPLATAGADLEALVHVAETTPGDRAMQVLADHLQAVLDVASGPVKIGAEGRQLQIPVKLAGKDAPVGYEYELYPEMAQVRIKSLNAAGSPIQKVWWPKTWHVTGFAASAADNQVTVKITFDGTDHAPHTLTVQRRR